MSRHRWTRSLIAAGALALPMSAPADTIQLTGTLRDFLRGDRAGGHPDFQTATHSGRGGFGLSYGLVTMHLDDENRPVYNPVRPARGTTIASEQSLAQWFRDVPGVNLSAPLTITLDNGSDTPGGVYTFHNSNFFPLNGQLFGNEGLAHNYHFTFMLDTNFTYEPGQRFTFIGDDDVWVYVNGTRVIDLGGVHSAATGGFLLFDGKAFVESAHFTVGGEVLQVDAAMAAALATKWSNLGLPGSCPIASGAKYIDLKLTGDRADRIASFNGESVTVTAAENLTRVTLKFNDGTTQRFDDLALGHTATFTGSGSYAGKTIIGAWVKTASDVGPYSQYLSTAGSGINGKLHFFFAERHTTQSNFRIDTSIKFIENAVETVSPMYD